MTFRDLRADEIDCRVSTVKENGCSLLLYKDARCDMRILDETVGVERWQRTHELINGNLFCNVGINFPEDGKDRWVWKQDVGTESFTEKEKGQASDAFKRACFNWGIGRELYTSPFIWVNASAAQIEKVRDKFVPRAKFAVKEMRILDGEIVSLKIKNDKTCAVVFSWKKDESVEEPPEIAPATVEQLQRLMEFSDAYAELEERNPSEIWDILRKKFNFSHTGDIDTEKADLIIKQLETWYKKKKES